MSPDRSQGTEQRLRDAYAHSAECVRRAHERAAGGRTARAHAARVDDSPAARTWRSITISAALRVAIEEYERSAREQDRFIAVVSHELRQPLNAILAAHEVLVAGAPAPARDAASEIMCRQLRLASRLIDDRLTCRG